MTVRLTAAGAIALEGVCSSEDAELLLEQLLATPGAPVDWRACEGAHTAVIQVLMAATPSLIGPPSDIRLTEWMHPWLTLAPSPNAAVGSQSDQQKDGDTYDPGEAL